MFKPDVPAFLDYLPEPLLSRLDTDATPVAEVPGLKIAAGQREAFPTIESAEALAFVVEVYEAVKGHLAQVLDQRKVDRAFIDRQTLALTERNQGRPYHAPDYETVIGQRDGAGRLVVGPHPERPTLAPVPVPDFLAGSQVTLFGPPDTKKMSINAMNALHRRLPGEAPVVAELVESSGQVPRWGADDEDSKTPIMRSFLAACENLLGCFDGSLSLDEPETGRRYALEKTGLARPIKRIPGLALPDGSHLLNGNPLPLHLVDFALHLFHAWARPEALVFYVPKLENEEEAAYLKHLIGVAEEGIRARHPGYTPGTVRLFIVFETPRAIFRIKEISHALAPHFLGGSLGWHDFLASTARLFRHDPQYRIPVKADPNIVINHIKESHLILARELGASGAIKIGGMYGILYEDGDPRSFQVSMVGYVKDVITQLKRGLDGFWVAHPSFVRIGVALVEAWRRRERDANDPSLDALIAAVVPDPAELVPLMAFVNGPDVPGLSEEDPLYLRGVLAADVHESQLIANSDPEEVRYNVFQALQYLADWLSGNGCVALPALLTNTRGERIPVRIMDDLATTERSRWELWAEVAHGRVPEALFQRILVEELMFIREGRATDTKKVAVRWAGEPGRWYPVAARLLRQLVCDPQPPEAVSELLLPFTFEQIRAARDPWAEAKRLCPGRYAG